jgi:hypothetical protein
MDIINPQTQLIGASPWNTDIYTFSSNTLLDLWNQAPDDVVEIMQVLAADGKPPSTDNQTCCITPATGQSLKGSKPLLRCDGCTSTAAILNNKITSIVIPTGSYVFKFSGSGFAGKFTTLTQKTTTKEACDCNCLPDTQVTATISICPVPTCFIWRSKKYTNLADFVSDVQTLVKGATYNSATCTFTACFGSVFPSLVIAACIPCPPLTITAVSSGMTSAIVTVTGGAATVSISGDCCSDQHGVGSFTFTGLKPNTRYVVKAVSDCGNLNNTSCDGCDEVTASTEFTTAACPAVVMTAVSNSPNSIDVTLVSGGSAWIELNGEKRYVANGVVTTFRGLEPAKEYFAVGTSDCGSFATIAATTQACPAINLTQTANTTNSITITLVSGGTASVFVGGDEAILANSASHTFTDLIAGKSYTAKVISECGNKASFTLNTAPCPAVDFTATALSTTSLQVTATAGAPLTISVVSQGGAVLDSADGVSSTIIFNDLPEGAIVTVKAVNECGKKKQLNVNLPDPVANPCPSFSLADASPFFKGFAYVAGDLIDPAANVAYRGGFIYPTAGEGHTVKVTALDGVTVIGYAVNKSDCANPCCNPVTNRTSVAGTTIDDSVHSYYIKGEVNKCNGSPVLPADRLFTKGDLNKCVNGVVVPLDCGDIVKVITCPEPSGCETNVWVSDVESLSGAGVCIGVGAPNYSNGVAIGSMRDFSSLEGQIQFSGSNPATHLPYTYTNTTGCPVLFEARLTGHSNAAAYVGAQGSTVGMAYNIGSNLAAPLSNSFSLYSGGHDVGTMRHTFQVQGKTGTGSGSVYHEETVSGAVFRKVLPAGASQTVYAQAWIILFQNSPVPNGTVIHTNMFLDIHVTKGAVQL